MNLKNMELSDLQKVIHVTISEDELILDIVARLDRIEVRMDRLEERMDRLEERMDRLEERMDRLEEKMDNILSMLDVVVGELQNNRLDRLVAPETISRHGDQLVNHERRIKILEKAGK